MCVCAVIRIFNGSSFDLLFVRFQRREREKRQREGETERREREDKENMIMKEERKRNREERYSAECEEKTGYTSSMISKQRQQ
jgi:hypothetical protein